MDAAVLHERLAQVLKRIATSERHIDEQRQHVAKLIEGGNEASEAQKLLDVMGRSLQLHVAHRDRLVADIVTSRAPHTD